MCALDVAEISTTWRRGRSFSCRRGSSQVIITTSLHLTRVRISLILCGLASSLLLTGSPFNERLPTNITMATSEPLAPRLLTIPPEIREAIYRLILTPDANRVHNPDKYTDYDFHDALVLFKLNKQIYVEARKVWRDLNVFVRVETPFERAEDHVAFEGHTPILVKGRRAKLFNDHMMSVKIGAPYSGLYNIESYEFVILLEDLYKFTKTWYYADLSQPELNSYLSLTLTLRDPYSPGWEEKRIPRWLQRRLLLPFGVVKNLERLEVTGEPQPFVAIVSELREEQAKPHRSPELCLQDTARLKGEGNVALGEGRYHDALRIYSQAWEAMHIVVAGRQRHIHADHFFGRELHEAPYIGKNGSAERLILRVQLVANTCLAYLKLKDFDEACFWGMRTINMIRDAMGLDEHSDIAPHDEAVLGFPAADQMGKIYYRTALAFKEKDDKETARKLLRVAKVYLPRDPVVSSELAACALRIG